MSDREKTQEAVEGTVLKNKTVEYFSLVIIYNNVNDHLERYFKTIDKFSLVKRIRIEIVSQGADSF